MTFDEKWELYEAGAKELALALHIEYNQSLVQRLYDFIPEATKNGWTRKDIAEEIVDRLT